MGKLQLCKRGEARRRLLWKPLSDVDALQILYEVRFRKRAHADMWSPMQVDARKYSIRALMGDGASCPACT